VTHFHYIYYVYTHTLTYGYVWCRGYRYACEQVDLVLLIGFMRILSAKFVQQYPDRIMNVHPSLLPAFAGGMDLNVHAAVLKAGVKETGT